MRFHVVFVDARFDDGIDRAGFFAEAAINAFEKIDVITRRATRTVLANIRFDRDCQRRADRFAEFAGDATFFAIGIASLRMQTTETAATEVPSLPGSKWSQPA